MLDSEPTNHSDTGGSDNADQTHGADAGLTGGTAPTGETRPTGETSSTGGPAVARKRAPRKAAKKAAPKAAASDPAAADDANAAAEQTSINAEFAPAPDRASAAPAKATRRRRATAPAGEPTHTPELPLATDVPGSPAASDVSATTGSATTTQTAGATDSASVTASAPPPRTRRRATKAAAKPAPSPDATATGSGDDGPANGDAAGSDTPSSPPVNDTLTDSTASVDELSADASAAPSTRRRSRAAATTTPFAAGSADEQPRTPRTPRKRGARKAAAAVEPVLVADGAEPDAVLDSDIDADAEAVLAAALALADATVLGSATADLPAAGPAIPVLFVAPGAAEPETPPAPRRRRRATSAATAPFSTPETADTDDRETVASGGRSDAESAPEGSTQDEDASTDTDTTASGSEDDGRRRRRRGRRGRGARADETPDATEGDADDDGTADDTSDDGVADEADDGTADDTGTGSRRRRRRRRGSSGEGNADNGSDDPPNTVVHVRNRGEQREPREPREPRSARAAASTGTSSDDEVRGIRGSSRLEAKRQRRRDGRDNGRRRVPILTEAEFLARRESVDRLMAVRQRGDRTQIAILEDGVLVEHYVTRASATSYVGNVYLGRVQNVLPSMEAAFVDIGKGRNGVLYAGEVNWDAAGLEGKARAIEAAMKAGDAVLVQVTKDPIGHKGARLTSQVSLPGRFLVLVPNGGMTGISRKLPDNERHRLKAILKKIVPEDAGVIVRTAAEGASEEDLTSDIERLKSQWEAITAHAAKPGDAPVLVHGEPDLAIRVVRDVFNEDFESMVVQGDGDGDAGRSAWDEIAGYLGAVAPELAARARRHTGDADLFDELRVDEQLAKALDRKVWLPSGGSLVIDRTEAMVVIDVNTGKFTGSGGNLEQTVTRNNLEAAEEIVRQLRLRDVGGIIVIDFIDMVLESNRDLVLRRLTECLGRDRTKHQVAEVTSLGLVQMTRKRVGEGLLEAFSEPCDKCHGRGVIVHTEPIDQPHQHDIDDGPSRGGNGGGHGSANGASGNGSSGGGASGNGSSRRNRRGRGGAQRDDAAVVEEHEDHNKDHHEDDPERRARAAAAMNAIARRTLSAEAQAATHADLDLMPGGVLDPDAVDAADHAAGNPAADNHATAEQYVGGDADPARIRAEIEAALDALPESIIDAALNTSDGDADGYPASGIIGETSIEFDEPAATFEPQVAPDDDTPPTPEPLPVEGGEAADATDDSPLLARSEPQDEPQGQDNGAAPAGGGRPRRRRAARRPAGPPAHV